MDEYKKKENPQFQVKTTRFSHDVAEQELISVNEEAVEHALKNREEMEKPWYERGFEPFEREREENELRLERAIEDVKANMPPVFKNRKKENGQQEDGPQEDIVNALLNSKRFMFDDSDAMDHIKLSIRSLNEEFEENQEEVMTIASMEAILRKYDEAMGYCNLYLQDPKKRKTSTRYRLVKENLQKLRAESVLFETAKEKIKDGTWANKVCTYKELLEEVESLPPQEQISHAQREREKKSEFAALKNAQPEFTGEGYALYKKYEEYMTFVGADVYRQAYQKGADVWKKAGGIGTISRDATIIMRPVVFDEKGQPKTKADQINHQWNLRWLKAWEEDDVETRENMIAEELPHIYDDVPFPDLTEEDLTDGADITEKLNRWIDENQGTDAFAKVFRAGKASMCIDQLKKAHPAVQKFLNENPSFVIISNIFVQLPLYISAYNVKKYRFESATEPKLIKVVDGDVSIEERNKKMDQGADEQMMIYRLLLKNAIKEYKERPNIPDAGYVKPEITDEMKQRKIKRAEDIKRMAEEQRQLQEVSSDPEYRKATKLTKNANPQNFLHARQTAAYDRMLSFAPYRDLIKNANKKAIRTLPGPATAVLSAVRFDATGQVLAEDKEKDEKNRRWLTALATNDLVTTQEMVSEQAGMLVEAFPVYHTPEFESKKLMKSYREDPLGTIEKLNQLKGFLALLKTYPEAGAGVGEEVKERLSLAYRQQQYFMAAIRRDYDTDLSGTRAGYAKSLTKEEMAKTGEKMAAEKDRLREAYREFKSKERLRTEKETWAEQQKPQEEQDAILAKRKSDAEKFAAEEKALIAYMKKNKLTLDGTRISKEETNRKNKQKVEGLPTLTDREIMEKLGELDQTHPQYLPQMSDLVTTFKDHYDISVSAMIRLETFRRMYVKKVDLEAKKGIVAERKSRIAEAKRHPVTFDIKPLEGVVQDKGQTYGNSCWARSGANLINAMQRKLKKTDPTLSFTKVDDTYFLGHRNFEYNEVGKTKANQQLGSINKSGMKDDYLAVKNEIEYARNHPDKKAGNLLAMADLMLEATDNRAMSNPHSFCYSWIPQRRLSL